MKTTVTFPMDWWDFKLLSDLNEPVAIQHGEMSLRGRIYPDTWDMRDCEGTCYLHESAEPEPRIVVPVKSLRVFRDYSDEIEVVYGIGDPTPVYITAEDRRRYRALEGLRAYRKTLTECAYAFEAEEDWPNEYMGHTVCGHKPEDHGPNGCNKILDYYDWDSPIFCPCEHYLKPAPLMRIENG